MNFRTLFFIFFFGLIGLTTTIFAQDPVLQEVDVLQGGEYPFQVNSPYHFPTDAGQPMAGNTVTFIEKIGDDYKFKYVPDPMFLGKDGFKYEVMTSVSPVIIQEYDFQIDVIASVIKTKDDFVHLTSQDEITIDVLSNDETSSANLNINLAHVLKGTATVNEDLTITYTPIDDSPDYIIYTVSDDFNTISSSTIYISQEYELEEDKVKNYEIASGNSQLIILPSDDFTLAVETYDNGSVEQINSFVYEYQADVNLEGSDEVNFVDSNGNTYQASISIIEKYLDEGYIKDDIFYSASNTSIEFDVKLNDTDQFSIADYTDDVRLQHLGNGVFKYTPLPYYTGIKELFYAGDNGITEETGTIQLVFNNFKPTNYFEYNLSTPQNQPRVIEYEVPLETEYFEIASLPTYGSVEIFTETESVDVGCEEGLQKVFAVYTPDEDYVGLDDLTIKYCASDNNTCDHVNITFDVVASEVDDCICVDDCVWAGDTNGDGKVSVVDALAIGRFIGSGGPSREESTFGEAYEGVSVENWIDNQVNGKNLKHVDANGDGFITIEDLDVVVDNYGDINSIISADVLGVKNVPFLLSTTQTEVEVGDLLVVYVTMGSPNYPAIDLKGVAFGVNLPASLVDSSTVEVEYLETGYLVKDAPYIDLTYQPSDGIIHTVGTKTNSLGSTGSGIIATVSFIVEENAEGIKAPGRSASKNDGDVIATINATDIVIEDSRGYKYALPNTSLDITVKSDIKEPKESFSKLNIHPNPSSDLVTVYSDNGAKLNKVSIYSMDGKLIKTISQIDSKEVNIDVNDFEKGLYIIKASNNTNTYSTKLIKA